MPEYELRTPANLKETLDILAKEPGIWKLFAGGTDLMVIFETGKLTYKKFLNVNSLTELKGFVVNEEDILIGAGCTYSQIQNHALIKKEFPLLVQSGKVTGAIAIQNRGTIGGNIANMSPAADTPPVLLAYDADLILLSNTGYRVVSYRYFHQEYKKSDLRTNEIIMAIRLRRQQGNTHSYYRKVGARSAQAISKVCMAETACVFRGQKVEWLKIGLGSVGPIPMRALKTEAYLSEKELSPTTIAEAGKVLLSEITPIDDIRSEAVYRNQVAVNLLAEFLEGLKR